ncbi:uncharacterized protein LOC129899790 [Solanum dulcamara]|uniref:uncharacterized protein LOC129899790 n=1 Tax=Solanum dulcamara TaxID=45834 RepID=UPI002486063E|nr:uncharacterized protein LOC129899790 [Solanum dulcamara]
MEAKEIAGVLDIPNVTMWKKNAETLNRKLGPSPKPSIEEAPNLELKPLLAYLRYAFLGVNNTLPVILSSSLLDKQVAEAFELLKKRLIEAQILIAPDWELYFELMCDASDILVGAVLGQRKVKIFYSIYYASKTLDSAQANYIMTEEEMLALVYAFDKFC